MQERARRYHYAVALKRVKGGWRVELALEASSRGQADKWSLSLLTNYDDTDAVTLNRVLVAGEILDAATLKRA